MTTQRITQPGSRQPRRTCHDFTAAPAGSPNGAGLTRHAACSATGGHSNVSPAQGPGCERPGGARAATAIAAACAGSGWPWPSPDAGWPARLNASRAESLSVPPLRDNRETRSGSRVRHPSPAGLVASAWPSSASCSTGPPPAAGSSIPWSWRGSWPRPATTSATSTPATSAGGSERSGAPSPYPSEALEFDDASWNVPAIQDRFRRAVDGFDPDRVIITDSWNMKPLLAEAVRGYPTILRFQALECLCPLNNVRLLPRAGGPLPPVSPAPARQPRRVCHVRCRAGPLLGEPAPGGAGPAGSALPAITSGCCGHSARPRPCWWSIP